MAERDLLGLRGARHLREGHCIYDELLKATPSVFCTGKPIRGPGSLSVTDVPSEAERARVSTRVWSGTLEELVLWEVIWSRLVGCSPT